MIITITKSARRFGYVIWSGKMDDEMRALINNRSEVPVIFNGFSVGNKTIDWKYHRFSIGYKFTRALPETAHVYRLEFRNGVLEVEATNA